MISVNVYLGSLTVLHFIQSTLVISKSKCLPEIIRDIGTSTYRH